MEKTQADRRGGAREAELHKREALHSVGCGMIFGSAAVADKAG